MDHLRCEHFLVFSAQSYLWCFLYFFNYTFCICFLKFWSIIQETLVWLQPARVWWDTKNEQNVGAINAYASNIRRTNCKANFSLWSRRWIWILGTLCLWHFLILLLLTCMLLFYSSFHRLTLFCIICFIKTRQMLITLHLES